MLETQGRMRFASFDALALGVAVVSESGQILFWNRWLEQRFGIARADVLGQSLAEAAPALAAQAESALAQALRGESGSAQRCEPQPVRAGAAPDRDRAKPLRLRAEPLDAYDLIRCAVLTLEELAVADAPLAAAEAAASEPTPELGVLRARIAAQDAQLRRQTDSLLRYARELSLASAAIDEALARCAPESLVDSEKRAERAAPTPNEAAQGSDRAAPARFAPGRWLDAL
jgi:hypothetical protein